MNYKEISVITDINVLEQLCNDTNGIIRYNVAVNKNCDYNLLKQIYKKHSSDNWLKTTIEAHPNWKLRDFT